MDARWSRHVVAHLLVVTIIICLFCWNISPDLYFPSVQSLVSAPVQSHLVSGVSGNRWTATRKLRTFAGPLVFQGEQDPEQPPVLEGGADIDAWFQSQREALAEGGPSAGAEEEEEEKHAAAGGRGGFECRSDKWVVMTTIFGPTKLAHQLERLGSWCTVVVADRRTPVQEWADEAFTRIKLLTLAEQSELGFKILDLTPLNHFGRKNIGYLYAVRAGAQHIYDTDDDNILKQAGADGGLPVDIPIVDARKPRHFVAQAWHCNFSEPDTRSWNPYAIYGQPTAWPRGLPLDDVRETSEACGHAAASAAGGGNGDNKKGEHAPYAYHKVFHRLPGITFPVQQSLADLHPDVDAIYRLTRYPPTFAFDVAEDDAEGLYGPDHVYAPYNAQATLHHYDAFWAMLLPVTVHGRVSDIWRSYVAQRLMWKYGMRVAFMKPWVDQERTAHDYLRDFDSEQPLYLRAGGLLDFLRAWRPSQEGLTLAAEQEELIVALYEHGVLEKEDVLLTQAWLQDLRSMGYRFPNARARFYESWSQERFLGGLAILTDEHLNGTELRSILPLVNRQLSMFAANPYPAMVFHIDTGEEDGWMNQTMKAELRRLAPNLRIEFYGTQYTWPRGEGYGLDGYIFCSQFLSYEMYRHPAVARLEYLFRFDEDITSFTRPDEVVALDFFDFMAAEGLDVVAFQRATEFTHVMEHMCPRSAAYLLAEDKAPSGADQWRRVEQMFCNTRIFDAGYIELYNLRRTFMSPAYFEFLEAIDFLQGIYVFDWREQSVKSVWLDAVSTNDTYRHMRAELPFLQHKHQDW